MKHSEPGLAMNHLSDNCRSRRIDANQTHIEYASPIVGRHEKGPDKIDGSVDCSRWAAQIVHRATRAGVSVREGGRTIQYSGPVASGYRRYGVLDASPSHGMTTSLRSGNAWIQITPVWIVSFDRAELPSPIPLLQTLFPLNGVFGIIELLKVEVRRGNLLVIIPSYHRHWSMPFPRAHDGRAPDLVRRKKASKAY